MLGSGRPFKVQSVACQPLPKIKPIKPLHLLEEPLARTPVRPRVTIRRQAQVVRRTAAEAVPQSERRLLACIHTAVPFRMQQTGNARLSRVSSQLGQWN